MEWRFDLSEKAKLIGNAFSHTRKATIYAVLTVWGNLPTIAISSDDIFDKAIVEDNNKLAKIIKDNNLTEDEVINMIRWHLNK